MMPAENRVQAQPVRYLDALRADVRAGLTATPKTLPPKYFYDARGSELFDEITRLPEYYLTRAETSILQRHSADIAALNPNAIKCFVRIFKDSPRKPPVLRGTRECVILAIHCSTLSRLTDWRPLLHPCCQILSQVWSKIQFHDNRCI